MSKMRSELNSKGWKQGDPFLTYDQTYRRVWEAVKGRRSLIHGRLHSQGMSCAIGSYFDEAHIALDTTAVDEIVAYNDSFPYLTPGQRWRKVSAWLKAKVTKEAGR